ncbi:uncharacterized protein TA05485 [Theileria annulata]|uniref:Cap-specific mRNA (nucleoside-2'-O-)-methyltransferase 2 n=1 Tax=Theileria annulata TaxID=5874 RepID=Q4UCQ7_THEAN|nr:uncharacterized protein TA05485 [Theileria annulata]CAI75394.1 hypothetical protein, conserved [Theileria annulata]|eukprot:XP_954870.1 hypothetical protein, conserved [Theileria annulata]
MSSQSGLNQTLYNNKRFVFRSNLNRLFSDTKKFPPSSNPCSKCILKKKPCICHIINSSVGSYVTEGIDSQIWYRTKRYEIDELNETKCMLNDLRNVLNDVDLEKWSTHTKLLDNTTLVIKHLADVLFLHTLYILKLNVNGRNESGVELVTNAWLKFYEILEVYKLVEYLKPNFKTEGGTLTSFHISECPGAFIASLNHNLKSKNYNGELKWYATSLNPYYEGNNHNVVLAEDILLKETYQNWLLGYDNSGNITKSSTADGSFNCQFDPNNQELLTSPLKFAEVVCALGLLRVGGCFIIKMFNLFEEPSMSIIALLSLCFKRLEVYKPFLSREANSEVYVICLDFNGITSILLSSLCKFVDKYSNNQNNVSIIPKEWIPAGFRAEFVDCAKMFAEIQFRSLRNALSLYKTVLNENPYYKEKREFANAFIKHFNIVPISPELRLVKRAQFGEYLISGKDTCSLGHLDKNYFSKFEERQGYHNLYNSLQKKRLENKASKDIYLQISDGDNVEEYGRSIREVVDFVNKSKVKLLENKADSGDRVELLLKLDEEVFESLLDDLKNQRYLKENWFGIGNMNCEDFKFSFFCNNDLLFYLIYLKSHCCSKIPLTTLQECLEKSSSYGEALTDLNSFPNSSTIHLAFIFKNFLNVNRYKYYLEITSNDFQQFPSISLLKCYNITGSILYNQMNHTSDGNSNSHVNSYPDNVNNVNGSNLFIFENIFELQTILNNFPGDGNVELCFEFNYYNLFNSNQSYKSLIGEILESNLKRNCDFIFCDLYNNVNYRELLYKELNTKYILVAQLIQALNCLNDNGDLVLRIFSMFTRFTVGILCCLSTVFDQVILYRPESVVNWSQELFVICKNYKDKDNSICRHFFQCLWDALALHHKTQQTLLQIIKPFHFTTIAKKLYDFNNLLLNNELCELLNKEAVIKEHLTGSKEFLNKFKLLDILYPNKLSDHSDVQLLKLQYMNETSCTVNNFKRKMTHSPQVTESESESNSPIWSDDNLDDDFN